MKQIEVTNETPLEQVLEQAQQEDIVLTRQGHAVALVSEIDDAELDPEFLASLQRAREQVKQGQTVSHHELKRQLGIE